ncbi:hypothetical protein [uncultured Aquimarina sp.]|uniref:hypothetical protein n=1 Tax=uncultured Aquimarina sp. TaxID=575652 RepID=UPI0026240402|nr:hypothetical protein [uncultured Aquimarina sp.]
MNTLINIGKNRTILISLLILIVSVISVYLYSFGMLGFESTRFIKQLIRFVATAFLLAMIYKGKNWAKITAIILFSLTILGILVALSSSQMILIPLIDKIVFGIIALVYAMAIYYFGFAKSFKAFFRYQNSKES